MTAKRVRYLALWATGVLVILTWGQVRHGTPSMPNTDSAVIIADGVPLPSEFFPSEEIEEDPVPWILFGAGVFCLGVAFVRRCNKTIKPR